MTTTVETVENATSLAHNVAAMLVTELPSIAYMGRIMTILSAEQDERDKNRITIVCRPIDFFEDLVRVVASLKIESISREPQPPDVAITEGEVA